MLSLHEPAATCSQSVTDCNQLPKLTTEVFDQPDCPKWAKYAAVDKDGSAVFFESTPRVSKWGEWWKRDGVEYYEFGNNYDASDWKHSLIERPAVLPAWCKVGEWVWFTGSEPKFDCYARVTEINEKGVYGKCPDGQHFYSKPDGLAQARLRPYNAEELRALVGKVINASNGSAGICTSYSAAWNEIKLDDDYWSAGELIDDDELSIDGKPCGKLEHLNKKGEWVE